MWYVIQVIEGNTDSAFAKCKNAIPESSYREMFVPMYECMFKASGKWMVIRKELFAGYFFVDTDDSENLLEYLKHIPSFVKPVCVGRDFVPITTKEQQMLESLLNEDRIVAMSQGDIVDGSYDIYKGPLVGKADLIRKVDRHKRVGDIEISILGDVRRVRVGLEIVNKIRTDEVSA